MRKLFSEEVGYGSPDTFRAVLHGSIAPVQPLVYLDRSRGCNVEESMRALFEITFDDKDVVVAITKVSTGQLVQETCICHDASHQGFTSATVGRRLPRWALEKWTDPTGVWKFSQFLKGEIPEGIAGKLPTKEGWSGFLDLAFRMGVSVPTARPESWEGIIETVGRATTERERAIYKMVDENRWHGAEPWVVSRSVQLGLWQQLTKSAGVKTQDDNPV